MTQTALKTESEPVSPASHSCAWRTKSGKPHGKGGWATVKCWIVHMLIYKGLSWRGIITCIYRRNPERLTGLFITTRWPTAVKCALCWGDQDVLTTSFYKAAGAQKASNAKCVTKTDHELQTVLVSVCVGHKQNICHQKNKCVTIKCPIWLLGKT